MKETFYVNTYEHTRDVDPTLPYNGARQYEFFSLERAHNRIKEDVHRAPDEVFQYELIKVTEGTTKFVDSEGFHHTDFKFKKEDLIPRQDARVITVDEVNEWIELGKRLEDYSYRAIIGKDNYGEYEKREKAFRSVVLHLEKYKPYFTKE